MEQGAGSMEQPLLRVTVAHWVAVVPDLASDEAQQWAVEVHVRYSWDWCPTLERVKRALGIGVPADVWQGSDGRLLNVRPVVFRWHGRRDRLDEAFAQAVVEGVNHGGKE